MNKFWDDVSKTVIAHNILDNERFLDILGQQKDTIIHFLQFNCYPDEEPNQEIATMKNQILKMYIDDISLAISKAEVYCHDLDEKAVEAVFELLQYVASAELTDDEQDKRSCYESVMFYTYFVKYMVQIHLSELLLKRIKFYKKTLKNFKHQGHHIGKQRFDDIVNKKIREVKRSYRRHKKEYQMCVPRRRDGRRFIIRERIETLNNNQMFDYNQLLSELEDIIETYENNYPNIISNGYRMSWGFRAFQWLLTMTSSAFLIYSILKRFGIWDKMLEIFGEVAV